MKEELNTKKVLMPFMIKMLCLSLFLQIIIATRNHKIDIVPVTFLILIAIYYYYFTFYKEKNSLKKIRFGSLMGHLIGYLTVNIGFLAHLLFLVSTNNQILTAESGSPLFISGGWFGFALCMPVFWGLTGMLPHLMASISNRGFEEK
jgi:4-amino-4-deoxy-L-arabinose transferase-like glycosyltransferase